MEKYTLRKSVITAVRLFGHHPLHLISKLWLPILLASLSLSFAIYICINCITAAASPMPLTAEHGYLYNIMHSILHLEPSAWMIIDFSIIIFLFFNSWLYSAFHHYQLPIEKITNIPNRLPLLKHVRQLLPFILKHFIHSLVQTTCYFLCLGCIFLGYTQSTTWIFILGLLLLFIIVFLTFHAFNIWALCPALSMRSQIKSLYCTYRPYIGKLSAFTLIHRLIVLCFSLMVFLPAIVASFGYFFDNVATSTGEVSGLPAAFIYICITSIFIGSTLYIYVKFLFLLPIKFLLPTRD